MYRLELLVLCRLRGMGLIKFIVLMLFVANAHAWGPSASANAPVSANITGWTEDPCDFPQHQDKCNPPPEIEHREIIDDAGVMINIEPPNQLEHTPFVRYNSNYE